MEPHPAAAKYPVGSGSALRLFPGSSSYGDPDLMEVSSWGPSLQKRKRSQVVPHEVIDVDGDDDPDGVVIIGESTSDVKNKQPVMYVIDEQKQNVDALFNKLIGSSKYHGSEKNVLDPKHSEPDIQSFDCFKDYGYDEDVYEEDYYGEYDFDTDLTENDGNLYLADKFDHLDLPPGVEAHVPWVEKPAPECSTKSKPQTVIDAEIYIKFRSFKRFDTVQDHSDHHYTIREAGSGHHAVKRLPKDWSKRILHEWKVLEKDLPDSIFVRVYEDRMDLLRAVIIGPAGTPYHDGLFFFDIYFPPNYPQSPPSVYYHSGGLRLNPNLYESGRVCLSLLKTWNGSGCELWNPSNSTMLQVLLSIQALVLNEKPYFNEPGFASSANTQYGERSSLAYNETAFLYSCKTMLYSLRRPPKNFECFVAGHFRNRGHAILVACRAYMNGAQVGCLVGDGVQDVDQGDKSCSEPFKSSLKKLFEDLLMEFTVKGADCGEFLAQKVKAGAVRAPDTTLRLGYRNRAA